MKLNVDLENHSYPIYIERNAIQKVHEYIPVSRKIAIITDTGVPEKWVNIVKEQCPDSFICTIPQGEPSKCFDQYKNLLEEMISHNMSRKDAIIAVGGGVVGDLAGFVAASYMRGIDFYNIPTTVLSQVDSSVGGKVAIDMGSYKNIVGAFWQMNKWHDIVIFCDYINHFFGEIPRVTCCKTNTRNANFSNFF